MGQRDARDKEKQIANMTDDGWKKGKEEGEEGVCRWTARGEIWGGKEGGNTETGRGHRRVERRARRRKLGQQEEAHFLFILLLSERPSLEVASSEHDSLPFFGRAAGMERKRKRGGGVKGANPGEAVANRQ